MEKTGEIANGSKSQTKTDDVLKLAVGDFGRWQLKISILMALLKLPIAWFQLSIVFLAPPTNFWCAPPEQFANMTEENWINFSVPKSNDSLKQEGLNSGYCQMNLGTSDETQPCLNGYNYNRTVFHSSIITEWNLVCGHQRLIDLTQVSLMFGVLIGNILFGVLADKKGRKTVLIICTFFQSLFGIVAAWISWYWGFVLARFVLGVFNGGIMVTSFVMCMEVVGGKWITIVPILYQIPFGFGSTIKAGLAYLLRDWRHFQFAISAISAVFVLYFWLIPESPRWLLATGNKEEAFAVLAEAAKANKTSVEKVRKAIDDLPKDANENTKVPFGALFSTATLRKRTCLLCINWTIVGVTFYAFSQYLGHVSHNLYFTVSVGGLIALPGTIFCVFVVSRYGRRWTIALAHLLTAVCFLAILFVPKGAFVQDWPRVAFAGLGIVGLSVSMPALYLFTGELFPTVLRNAGVGASVMFARIGSIIAPLIIALQETSPYLPLSLLSIAAVIDAILVLPLPETKGKKLPDTIMDLENSNENGTELQEKVNGSYSSIPKEDELL